MKVGFQMEEIIKQIHREYKSVNYDTLIFNMKGNYIWKKYSVKPKKNFARCKEDMTWKIVEHQVYIRNTTGIKTQMQM